MSTTGRQGVCFLVCEACGPTGLMEDLQRGIRERGRTDCRVVVKQAPCLLACSFKQVVKVLDDAGQVLQSYSSVARNGFEALGDDPAEQLLDTHVGAVAATPVVPTLSRKAG